MRKKLLAPGRYWCVALAAAYMSAFLAMVGVAIAFVTGLIFGSYVLGALYFQWWSEHHTIRRYNKQAAQRSTLATDADRR